MLPKMRHLVIFLPGIMGSVLQKDGKDLWALSGQAVWQYLRTWGKSLSRLQVNNDDWRYDDLEDGVTATRLISDIYSVPGLVEHAGYSTFVQHFKSQFDITEGSIHIPRSDANFFVFPYDWRRDNRATARKLGNFIDTRLPIWRETSGAKDAQVILIAHSMGGLISRYYLEVLGGWHNCRALITIGTPHRGALGALDKLSNGFRKGDMQLFHSLGTLVRSFTSVYQLLPTYQVVEFEGKFSRVTDFDEIPNLSQAKAKASREEFHETIRHYALRNRNDPLYKQLTLPWVGTRHNTLQSAILNGGRVTVRYSPPIGVEESFADGDGTVPRVSSVPSDLEGQAFERFAVERHGWLTNNPMTISPLIETVKQISIRGYQNLHGATDTLRPSISLELESLFLPDEPVIFHAKLQDAGKQLRDVNVKIALVGQPEMSYRQGFQLNSNESQTIEFGGLSPGLYQFSISPQIPSPQAPITTHGIFEVIDQISLE